MDGSNGSESLLLLEAYSIDDKRSRCFNRSMCELRWQSTCLSTAPYDCNLIGNEKVPSVAWVDPYNGACSSQVVDVLEGGEEIDQVGGLNVAYI
jgi:hypothetical protein